MTARRAFTLVELIFAAMLGSLLLAFAFRLTSSSLKTSMKGASHLSNIQAAVLLCNLIEQDLQKAVNIAPAADSVIITVLEEIAGSGNTFSSVTYEHTVDNSGLRRVQTHSDGSVRERIFCEGFKITSIGQNPVVSRCEFGKGRFGARIQFQVASLKGEEQVKVSKLIFCVNASQNVFIKDRRK